MSIPEILAILTALIALGAAGFGSRPKISAGIAAGGAAILAGLVLLVPIDEASLVLGISIKLGSHLDILGRSFILDQSTKPSVGLLYLIGGFLIGGSWMARASRYLPSVGLIMVTAIGASLMIQPFLFAAIFLEIAAMGAVLILVSPERPRARGALRLLSLYTLAMMIILLAGWMLEAGGVTSARPELARKVSVYLGLGFAILMAVPPFHLWLPSAARDLNIYAITFTAILLQSAGLFLLLRFLDTYEWMRGNEALLTGIRTIGIATIWFGSMSALAQVSPRKVVAYGILTDFGVTLLAVGIGTAEGYKLALAFIGARIIGYAIASLGLVSMEMNGAQTDEVEVEATKRRWPIVGIATLVGLLSLAGFPLTAGFPDRWALMGEIAPIDPMGAFTLLSASIAIAIAALRAIFLSGQIPGRQADADLTIGKRLFLIGGIALCLVFGLFPGILSPWIEQSAVAYGVLIR